MSKIYMLLHRYEFAFEAFDDKRKNFAQFRIGAFYEKEKCFEIIEHCRKQPGFRDYPDGFYIEEFYLDSLYNTPTNFLQQIISGEKPSQPEAIYLLYYLEEHEDGPDFSILLGIFSSEEKARKKKRLLLSEPMFKGLEENIDIYEDDTVSYGWLDGFFSA